jgi:hypothetical protein
MPHNLKYLTIMQELRTNTYKKDYITLDSPYEPVNNEEVKILIAAIASSELARQTVKYICLNNNRLTDQFDFSALENLKDLYLSNNRLTVAPIVNPAIERIVLENNPVANKHKYFVNFQESAATFKLAELSSQTYESIINLFAQSIDQAVTNFDDLNMLAYVFNDRILSSGFNAICNDELRLHCMLDTLLASKLVVFLEYIVLGKYLNKKYVIKPDFSKHSAFAHEINLCLKQLATDDVWLPDMRVLRPNAPRQFQIGKTAPNATTLLPFYKSTLCRMHLSFWDGDNCGIYFDRQTKKQYKVRLALRELDHDLEPIYKLKRNIDANVLESGGYLYATSPKGALLVGNCAIHACFRAGQMVACAGHIMVNDKCEIEHMDNNSGHMRPTNMQLMLTAFWLNTRGYLNNSCKLVFHSPVDPVTDENNNSVSEITVAQLRRLDKKYKFSEKLHLDYSPSRNRDFRHTYNI